MSEISDTATLIKLSSQGTYFLAKGSVKAILYLYQTIKKLQAANVLGKGEVEEFEKFLKATEGKYRILNIPTEKAEELNQMREDLNQMHISYTILPDLNVGDGQTQIAYAIADTEKVEAWYRSFCLDHLKNGGEKQYTELMNLTEGQVSIANIPWPPADACVDEYAYVETADQEIKQKLQIPSDPSNVPKDFFPKEGEELKEEVSVATLEGRLQQLKQDLDHLHINYMVLPDMNAGNGYLQIAYATADAPKLKAWYELYQKTMLSSGTPVENMKEISWEEYLKTTDQVPSSERAAQLLQKTKQTEAKEATKKQDQRGRKNSTSAIGGKDMWKKRKPPYLLFFLFFLLCILAGYYFSGVFQEPGLNFSNISDRLNDILAHPFVWYWNEKSAACIIGSFLVCPCFIMYGWNAKGKSVP